MSGETRELARRRSGTDEILLVWESVSDQVRLAVRDADTGAGLEIAVAPARALDAFRHPYAYAAKSLRRTAARAPATI